MGAKDWMFSGEKLAAARIEAGLTQEELAQAMGLPASQQCNISRWEGGDCTPKAASIKAMVEALKPHLPSVSMDYFMVSAMPLVGAGKGAR